MNLLFDKGVSMRRVDKADSGMMPDTDSDPQNNETQSERLRSYACKVPGVKVLCSHNPLREANQSDRGATHGKQNVHLPGLDQRLP